MPHPTVRGFLGSNICSKRALRVNSGALAATGERPGRRAGTMLFTTASLRGYKLTCPNTVLRTVGYLPRRDVRKLTDYTGLLLNTSLITQKSLSTF